MCLDMLCIEDVAITAIHSFVYSNITLTANTEVSGLT